MRNEKGDIIGTVVTGYTFENSNFLDELKALHNTELTIFANDIRIATTITQNGERAVGTSLNENIAKTVLEEGNTYTGKADILGVPHITEYVPLRNTEGEIVGVVFAGLSEAAANKATRDSILHMAAAAILIIAICAFILFRFMNKNIKQPMYMAKSRGKNQYALCTTDMKEEVKQNIKLSNYLYRVQERGELIIYYQPQIKLNTGKIIGLEALLRWNHPEMGMILPNTFIHLAEMNGTINSIGEWVLKTAIRQNKLWQDKGYPHLRMGKGRLDAIDAFRKSGNGVLCASDSAGEGIDLAGDILSSLIVVRLPFPAPDPVLEYEKTLYPDFYGYLNKVIVPGMLIKLRQWIGRGIRRETDTCVFSILDSRASRRYRNDILAALPDMPVTHQISDVSRFIADKKTGAYFE